MLRKSVLPEAPPIDFAHPSSANHSAASLIIQLQGQFLLTASRTKTGDAAVSVYSALASGTSDESSLLGKIISYKWKGKNEHLVGVTALQLDEAPRRLQQSSVDFVDDEDTGASRSRPMNLAVFYSSSDYSLFRIHLPSLADSSTTFKYEEIFSSIPASFPYATPPILEARFHSPLLVTCDERFTLRFWRIASSSNTTLTKSTSCVTLTETSAPLRSHESCSPVVLSLSPVFPPTINSSAELGDAYFPPPIIPSKRILPTKFKVTLAYSTPVFPSAFTVGVQEFMISMPPLSPKSLSAPKPLSIVARHALASASPWCFRRQTDVRTVETLITSLEYFEPWLVASRSDNTISVYKITSMESLSTTSTPPRLEISPVRTLFGHTGCVYSVAVNGHKIVSGGADGKVRVWDLGEGRNHGEAVEIDEEGIDTESGRIRKVAFDERKIVSIQSGKKGLERVKLLRFD